MSLTVPEMSDLVTFSGTQIAGQYYTDTAYVATALQQATDLLTLVTDIEADPPETPVEIWRMTRNAILEMAEAIVIKQPYRAVVLNPFQSETIGTYTYSKLAKVAAHDSEVVGGQHMRWWAQAIEYWDLQDVYVESTSTHVFEDDNVWLRGRDPAVAGSGRRLVMGPIDIDPSMYGPIFKTNYGEWGESGYPGTPWGPD